ncbi:MAG: histidine--tRNA ligase [Actinomycetota bacterium]
MAAQINPPRGMRDFLPIEKANRDATLTAILECYRSHGFQEIETPAMESLDRLTSSQGGENEKLAFRVLKRGEDLEAQLGTTNPDNLSDLGLRFDLTVPLTRYYATNFAKLPKVFKAIQAGPVWRAERPQKGRYRQFVQCDIDIIGEESDLAEIELLVATLDALEVIGLSSATIRVNTRELLTESIAALGLTSKDYSQAMITIDKLDKLGVEGVTKELAEQFSDSVAQKAKLWLSSENTDLIPKSLKKIFEVVGQLHPNKLRFDKTLVRGMGYYTGPIFEIEHPDSGSSIGGGGRYDGMVGKWLGKDVPAAGISIGFERVVELAKLSSKADSDLVLVFEPEQLSLALRIQGEAIDRGLRARIEPRPKKLNILLENLAESGFGSFALISNDSSDLDSLEIKPIR